MIRYSLHVMSQVRCLVRVARLERLDALIACTGDLTDLPVGYLASKLVGVPFYIYLFDDYRHQWPQPLHAWFARYAEPIVVKGAKAIILPNEFMRDAYRERYGVVGVIVRNPCEEADPTVRPAPWPAHEGEIRIVYTGAIYHAHYDAFRNLIASIALLTDLRIKLHLYTSQSGEVLRQEGIVGPVVHHEHVSIAEAIQIQRVADVLFLPLAFNSPVQDVLRTAAPGKLGEYLDSGRPVLAHVPADSFVSWFLRAHDCGAVVDRLDPTELATAIRHILDDPCSRSKWHDRAQAIARAEFDPHVACEAFLRAIQ